MDPGALLMRFPFRLRRPRLLTASLLLVLVPGLLLFAGILAMYLLREEDPLLIDRLLPNYFAYYQDLPVAPILILLLILGLAVRKPRRGWPIPPLSPPLIATCVAVLCYAGTWLVFSHFPLSRDEFMAEFDAQILRSGALLAPLPEPWRGFGPALLSDFVFEARGAWSSTYLPVNAAIRALFGLLGDRALAGPALAAASILLVHAIARRLIPGEREPAIVAMLLLATSSQFLIAAMTPYAMIAHLAFNLAWLWLLLRRGPWNTLAAGLVSFAACGLHQMVFHPLFAAPFLPWLWFAGRRRAALFLLLVLAGSSIFWLLYPVVAALSVPGGAGGAAVHVVQGPIDRIEAMFRYAMRPLARAVTADNAIRLVTWQNPLIWVLTGAALLSIRRQSGIIWALFGGIVATVVTMQLLMPLQSHGWGYRYLHGLLGNFALLAAFGWQRLTVVEPNPARLRMLFDVSLAVSLALLLPARAWQAHDFVSPYVEADRSIDRIDADYVIIEDKGRWYAADLVRNDPFLRQRPIRLLASKLPPRRVAELCRSHRVVVLDRASPELEPLRPVLFRSERQGMTLRQHQFQELGCA